MIYKHSSFKSTLSFDGKVIALYKYQIEAQTKLLKKIKTVLPSHLSSHALYCVLSNKKVSLYTDSAIWSSQLRFYHQPILQSLLSSHEGIIETLQIKVIPQTITEQPIQKRIKNVPSAENISFILEQAEHQSDEQLKNALLRLGKSFQKKHKDQNNNKFNS